MLLVYLIHHNGISSCKLLCTTKITAYVVLWVVGLFLILGSIPINTLSPMKCSSEPIFTYAISGIFILITTSILFSCKVNHKSPTVTKVFDQVVIHENTSKIVLQIKDKKAIAYELVSADGVEANQERFRIWVSI
jgi:hypothetical protein